MDWIHSDALAELWVHGFGTLPPMELPYIACVVLVLIVVRLYVNVARSRVSHLPLPPGPAGLPVIGNTLQIPQSQAWRQYHQWSKEYGPIYSLSIAGRTFIVLAGAHVAQQLLNKAALKSSDRPPMVMANNLVTRGRHILLRPYDADYRMHQRMHAPVLSTRASNSYAKVFDVGTRQILFGLLNRPRGSNFKDCLVKSNLKVLYGLIYGINIETGEEPCIRDSRAIQQAFGRVTTPGAYLVDTFPFLNWLPAFLAPWKREAELMWNAESVLHLRNMDAGLRASSWTFAKQFVSSPEAQHLSEVDLAYSLGILVNAGFDTTVMQLEWLVVALLNHPHCVERAQAEIDCFVGRDRLPELADKDNLPYIVALIEETMRWRSIMNGGFPHYTTEEDEFQGYRIPKNAVILPLYYSIDHDGSVFDDPDTFNPDRFMPGSNGPRAPVGAFGFGRRACTGRNIARNNMFLHAARLLWAFDIKHDVDGQGQKLHVDPDATTDGFNTQPLPFSANFEVRDQGTADIIKHAWLSADQDISHYMHDVSHS